MKVLFGFISMLCSAIFWHGMVYFCIDVKLGFMVLVKMELKLGFMVLVKLELK